MTPDWDALVAEALGSEDTPPNPWQLFYRLERWAHDFERAEGGPPVEADYPEPVQEFFGRLAAVTRAGRPCHDERVLYAAKLAWDRAVLRDLYEQELEAAQFAKEWQTGYRGTPIGAGTTPTEAALDEMQQQTDMTEGTLRDLAVRKKQRQRKR